MTDLIIVHQSYQDSGDNFLKTHEINFQGLTPIVWQTCRRRILFFDEHSFKNYQVHAYDEVYSELDAEEFLIEVLCGLKSPLVGETEVFGQFKTWWQSLPAHDFKNKFSARVQQIYSIVKKVRDEALCGLGSQSYGSLLRKKISEIEPKHLNSNIIDFIGAGQLVEEIIPWVQKKWSYRIWCRNPEKVQSTTYGKEALALNAITEVKKISSLVVVAAPITHDELNAWIKLRKESNYLYLFDFRHDSMSYFSDDQLTQYLHLDHFTNEVQQQKQQIQNQIELAKNRINQWKATEQSRIQVRPFGWDDL